jgi:hypothetical protein
VCISGLLVGIFVCSPSGEQPLGRCRKIGDHPQEDLAKYGYEPHKAFIYSSISLATHSKTKYRNLAIFFLIFSPRSLAFINFKTSQITSFWIF